MSPNEARRKLAAVGFKKTADHKTNELWAFRDITVAVTRTATPSQNMKYDVLKAIRKAEARNEFEPKPLATLADEFQKAFKENPAERTYRCLEPLCFYKAPNPEALSIHVKGSHPKEVVAPETPVLPVQNNFKNQTNVPMSLRYTFTKEERRLICDKLRPWFGKYTYAQMAEMLRNEDFKNPSGLTWTHQMVGNYINRWGIRDEHEKAQRKSAREAKAAEAVISPPTKTTNTLKVPASIALVLEDHELTVGQKVAILSAAKVQIPTSLQLVLEDPALDDEQKHRIFKMLMGVK